MPPIFLARLHLNTSSLKPRSWSIALLVTQAKWALTLSGQRLCFWSISQRRYPLANPTSDSFFIFHFWSMTVKVGQPLSM